MPEKIDGTGNAVINNIKLGQQTTHPSSPASGYELLYVMSGTPNGGLYVKDSDGRQIGPFLTGTANASSGIATDGWNSVAQSWTYASADDPVYQIYVSGDVTANADYKLGNKIKCTNNSTTFYGFIVKVGAYDGGNNRTPVDIYGGTDYDLANSAITTPYISKVKSPDGFPLASGKWTVESTNNSNNSKASAVVGTWYYADVGSVNISIPIGAWKVSWQAVIAGGGAVAQTAANVFGTLSTSNNSESDNELTAFAGADGASGAIACYNAAYKEKSLVLTSKTPYYLLTKTTLGGGGATVAIYGAISKSILRAQCNYL